MLSLTNVFLAPFLKSSALRKISTVPLLAPVIVILSNINFFIDKGQVVFISVEDIITIRALEGSYPNYSQLLPETFSNVLEFNRKEFISSLASFS